ncbi:unnamed protein product [Prorocentrum cordatum]|uniref:Uncharacterized protein n=1 Tax=Prorocentrum cordatum TaxID=2364126 RepID=A0ABN9RMR9_9DINO|nr:unnamed protein product [Polarella glacialis]
MTAMPFERASGDIAISVACLINGTRLIDILARTCGWRSVIDNSNRKWAAVTYLLVQLDPQSLEMRLDMTKVRLAGETIFRECTLDEAIHAIIESSVPTFRSHEALRFGLSSEHE